MNRARIEEEHKHIFPLPLGRNVEMISKDFAEHISEIARNEALEEAANKLEEICSGYYDHAKAPFLQGAEAIRNLKEAGK